jgi:hypothetical protein
LSPTFAAPKLIGEETCALLGRLMRSAKDLLALLPPAIAGADCSGPAFSIGAGVGSGARTMIGGDGGSMGVGAGRGAGALPPPNRHILRHLSVENVFILLLV